MAPGRPVVAPVTLHPGLLRPHTVSPGSSRPCLCPSSASPRRAREGARHRESTRRLVNYATASLNTGTHNANALRTSAMFHGSLHSSRCQRLGDQGLLAFAGKEEREGREGEEEKSRSTRPAPAHTLLRQCPSGAEGRFTGQRLPAGYFKCELRKALLTLTSDCLLLFPTLRQVTYELKRQENILH